MPMNPTQPQETELGFENFVHGWISDLQSSSLPVSALSTIQNFKYIGNIEQKIPISLQPRYGSSKVATSPLPTSQICYAAWYFNNKYIAASNTKLYYWNSAGSVWVEIGNLDGIPKSFVIFNNKLIISDGGVTKCCDTSWNFNKLHNYYQNELVGTGNGSQTVFYLDHYPIVANSQIITVNGVTKTETTDYTIVDATGVITFIVAPPTGHDVVACYLHENAGPKSKCCLVRKSRLFLTGDPDNIFHIWYSGLNNENAWNSAGIGGVPDGGFEQIGKDDGYAIKDFTLYFDKLYVVKERSVYYCTFAEATGKISSILNSIGNISVKSNRTLLSADNKMFLVHVGGTYLFKSQFASVADFIESSSISSGKINKIHLENYNENAFVVYYPGDSQIWLKLEGYENIFVSTSDGLWTKYKFLFDVAGLNFAPNGEMLISSTNGYLYKYDTTVCKDDGVLPSTFFYTSFQDFGSSLVTKEANKWYIGIETEAVINSEVSLYVDKNASTCHTIEYDSVITNLLVTEDATMLTSDANFVTGDIILEYNIFDGVLFKRIMLSVNLTLYSNVNVIFNGIKFISRLIKE